MERLTIIGPSDKIENVSILGPLRDQTQVEISLTDARRLGIAAPIRISGDVYDTPGCTLVGPSGSVVIQNGVIVAKRHVHLDLKSAQEFNLKNNQFVSVRIQSELRSLIFEDVIVRVSENFLPVMHIDTDEANAAGISNTTVFCEIFC